MGEFHGKYAGDDEYNLLMIKVIGNDDENAFYTLFNSFYAPLCTYACRFIRDLQVREDCVQDVFLKLWKDRKKIEITTSIRSYLLSATRNHCLNYLQRKELELNYEQQLLNQYSDVQELYSLTELEELINKAIAGLPEKYRTVFEMNRFEEMTYKEIAGQLNISVKTVEAYMSKALVFLRNELKDYYMFLFII